MVLSLVRNLRWNESIGVSTDWSFTPTPNEGLVDWLLGCPDKGFFVPIESASTDSL